MDWNCTTTIARQKRSFLCKWNNAEYTQRTRGTCSFFLSSDGRSVGRLVGWSSVCLAFLTIWYMRPCAAVLQFEHARNRVFKTGFFAWRQRTALHHVHVVLQNHFLILSGSQSPTDSAVHVFFISFKLLQFISACVCVWVCCEPRIVTNQYYIRREQRISIGLNSFLIYTRFFCQKRMHSKTDIYVMSTKETITCGLLFSHRIIYLLSFFLLSHFFSVCSYARRAFNGWPDFGVYCVFWCSRPRFLPTVVKLLGNDNLIYELKT